MLKAVVFDDEYIVCQGLSRMIDWQRFGVELVGTAGDGLAALQLFREQRPDIVLTDIRMPGMDGLQLIETVADEAKDTMFIVLSGFNEFEYVRRAIGLGVVDYLEKPITVQKIEEAMTKTLERIKKQRAFSEMKSDLEASREQLLEKATLDLLLAGDKALEKWKQQYGARWSDVCGVSVLAFAAERLKWPESDAFRIVDVTNGEEKLSVVFHYALPSDELWGFLVSEETNGSVFASGGTYKALADAPVSCKEAQRALRYGRFLEESGWVRIEDIVGDDKQPEDLTRQEEAVLFALRTGDKAELRRSLDELQIWMEEQKLDPDKAEREMIRLIYLALEVLKETGGSVGELGDIAHQELNRMHTREEMFGWLHSKLAAMLLWLSDARRSTKHAAVEKALAYMEHRFGQDISLQEIAEHVGLNATYFSLLFKEEMGISYIKHLTNRRMEQAKVLLRSGMLVSDVSEKVGYLTYRHFTETFKKQTGLTPKQYRESCHIEHKDGAYE
jgi:two-component system response regulator YesN